MQSDKRNLSMVMDLYELTMSYGYFKSHDINKKVAFDVFYRKNPEGAGYAIFAGLEQIVEYILNLHFDDSDIEYLRGLNLFDEAFLSYLRGFKFKGDVYSLKEGTIMYPNEPILTVVAPLIDAQIVETAILLEVNHQSLIATKARRIVRAAKGRAVSDFGARRAHNMDAAVYGARAAYIGGVSSTATVLAGKMFDIPVSGTMAHSFVMFYDSEYEAFKQYALTYPKNTILLVDTYDVLKQGVPNAIRVAHEVLEPMGYRLKGIRLDSGDLAYLSKKCRNMLDDAGLCDCKIVISNSLDERIINSLIEQDAKIDILGVGERLITSRAEPVFGAVYKLCAKEENGRFIPKIKISENEEKITNPGLKKLYRIYDEDNMTVADLIALDDEKIDINNLAVIDPKKPWKKYEFKNAHFKELLVPIFKDGNLVYDMPQLKEIRSYVNDQLTNEIWPEEQRIENPHEHYLDMTESYYKEKNELLTKNKQK